MSLVFSLDLFLQELKLIHVESIQPCILVSLPGNLPILVWCADERFQDSDTIQIGKAYQLMLPIDVFQAIEKWNVQLTLAMPDQVPLGQLTYDFKPLIGDALASCGSSRVSTLEGSFVGSQREIIASLKFEVRAVYFPGTEHSQNMEIFLNIPLERSLPKENYYTPRIQSMPTTTNISEQNSDNSQISSFSNETSSDKADLYNNPEFVRKAREEKTMREQQEALNFTRQIASIPQNESTNAQPNMRSIKTQNNGISISPQNSRGRISGQQSSNFTTFEDDFVEYD